MKEINFRIIELENYQMLLAKDFDNDQEDAPDLLCFTFFVDGIKITQSMNFSTEEKRDKAFESVTNEQAQNMIDSTLSMIE